MSSVATLPGVDAPAAPTCGSDRFLENDGCCWEKKKHGVNVVDLPSWMNDTVEAVWTFCSLCSYVFF